MKESKSRAIIKTISWRVIATVTTIILVYLFTKNIKLALEIGALEMFLKLLFYYIHERTWNTIKWGRVN